MFINKNPQRCDGGQWVGGCLTVNKINVKATNDQLCREEYFLLACVRTFGLIFINPPLWVMGHT